MVKRIKNNISSDGEVNLTSKQQKISDMSFNSLYGSDGFGRIMIQLANSEYKRMSQKPSELSFAEGKVFDKIDSLYLSADKALQERFPDTKFDRRSELMFREDPFDPMHIDSDNAYLMLIAALRDENKVRDNIVAHEKKYGLTSKSKELSAVSIENTIASQQKSKMGLSAGFKDLIKGTSEKSTDLSVSEKESYNKGELTRGKYLDKLMDYNNQMSYINDLKSSAMDVIRDDSKVRLLRESEIKDGLSRDSYYIESIKDSDTGKYTHVNNKSGETLSEYHSGLYADVIGDNIITAIEEKRISRSDDFKTNTHRYRLNNGPGMGSRDLTDFEVDVYQDIIHKDRESSADIGRELDIDSDLDL